MTLSWAQTVRTVEVGCLERRDLACREVPTP